MLSRLPKQRVRTAFTLLELLVVMGIIAILLVAVLPAVNSLSKSGGRKAAISSLIAAIEQARALAIKDGQSTYVVFPAQPVGGASTITDSKILERYFYRSVAIFEEDPANPATPKQITNWKTFPTGVSLRSAISSSPWSSANFAFIPGGSPQSFPYLKFNAQGEVESPIAPTGPIQLGIFEGYVIGTSEKATSSSNFTETIQIAQLTGRAQYTP